MTKEFDWQKERRKLIRKVSKGQEDLFVNFVKMIKLQDEEFIKRFKEKLRNCDEFFNVEDYKDIKSTDKFMGIVELFLRELTGEFK